MRIAEETPDRLTLEEKPWVIGGVLAFLIVVLLLIALLNLGSNNWLALGMTLAAALLGGAFVAFVRRVIVIFDRTAGAVVIRTASVMGQTEATYPLSDIRGASVQTSVSRTSNKGTGRNTVSKTHRPVLHLPGGDIPLTEVYSGGDSADRMAEAVIRWLGLPAA